MTYFRGALACAWTLSIVAIAQDNEHPAGRIRGTHIDVQTQSHSFAGTVNGGLVLGGLNEATGESRLSFSRNEERAEAVFRRDESTQVLGGELAMPFGDTRIVSRIEFLSFARAENRMRFRLNGEEIQVEIQAPSFTHNHYRTPTYVTQINGADFRFTLESGEACPNYSAHLIMMMVVAHDFAQQFSLYRDYQSLAQSLERFAEQGGASEVMVAPTLELFHAGYPLMRRYAERNPVCAPQFDMMLSELETVPVMDLTTAFTRYHNGEGLPEAPRHCMWGRSMVMHPYFNGLRLADGLTPDERLALVNDFRESGEHVIGVKKNIDLPPAH